MIGFPWSPIYIPRPPCTDLQKSYGSFPSITHILFGHSIDVLAHNEHSHQMCPFHLPSNKVFSSFWVFLRNQEKALGSEWASFLRNLETIVLFGNTNNASKMLALRGCFPSFWLFFRSLEKALGSVGVSIVRFFFGSIKFGTNNKISKMLKDILLALKGCFSSLWAFLRSLKKALGIVGVPIVRIFLEFNKIRNQK